MVYKPGTLTLNHGLDQKNKKTTKFSFITNFYLAVFTYSINRRFFIELFKDKNRTKK